jgi:hypothetical protein
MMMKDREKKTDNGYDTQRNSLEDMCRWHGNGSDGVIAWYELDLGSIHLITRYFKIEERDLNVYI